MKKIKIVTKSKTNGHYRIVLGNNTIHDFKSEKLATKFLVDTGRYLTAQLVEANSLYCTMHTLYREYWFYFYNSSTSGQFHLQSDQRKCDEYLDCIKSLLDKIVKSTHWGMSGSQITVFSDFEKVAYYIRAVLLILKSYAKSKSNTVHIYQINNLVERVMTLSGAIQAYGTSAPSATYDSRIFNERLKVLA